jgi:hypothetical protein
MTTVDTRQARPQTVGHPAIADHTTRRLLACGIVAGLLFAGVSFIQGVTRQGFDVGTGFSLRLRRGPDRRRDLRT